uniref:RanBD1 domain-containing protein n=1 Tax=Electrophorus electricus TaxID=8005 RepID=A0A4W4H9Q6_ELEEL
MCLQKPVKGFLFAKLYAEAKEYELAKRYHLLLILVRDPKAHRFLGQLHEQEGEIEKAVGCYKRSVDLNPAQRDLVLKVAELLCGKPVLDSRAEFWVEKAAKLLPGNPAVFDLREKLLSLQGQRGWNQLYDLLQSELQLRPSNAHVNRKLVQLYCSDGRLEDAARHCLDVERSGVLKHNLDWHKTVILTLQEYLAQPSVSSNDKACHTFQKEFLLAHCNVLRLTLAEKGCQESLDALQIFDQAMQTLKNTATNAAGEFLEVFTEMRAHLYLYAGTLLLKMAMEKEQQWRAVVDLAALCYIVAYQVRLGLGLLGEAIACYRQSQAGHMLVNLNQDTVHFVKEVVEVFGNRSGQDSLFEMLFNMQTSGHSFIENDDISGIRTQAPDMKELAKSDSGSVLHCGDLQHLTWLGLQWSMMGQRPALKDWLTQLFPRLTLETFKLDTNTPESICLLDLEVFLCGVIFTSHTQLQETEKISANSRLHEPKCLPLQLMRLLSSEKQREWWDAVYSLIHKKAAPNMSAKLRMIVQHGLSTLRAREKHGLQPALLIHWAKHLSVMGDGVNSYYDQKEYVGRSVHYWNVVLPLLEKIEKRRTIAEPLDPLFMHFRSKDIQVSEVKGYEEEAVIAFATLLDIEDTKIFYPYITYVFSFLSSLSKIYQRLSEEAGNGVEETRDMCINFLQQFRKCLSKIYNASADDVEKLPVSMEEIIDLLNDVNQQLGENREAMDQTDGGLAITSSPRLLTEADVALPHKFSMSSPAKSVLSPSKRPVFSPKMAPHWAEDQKSILQVLCQKVEALKNEVHDLRQNASEGTDSHYHRNVYAGSYSGEALQEQFPAAQTFPGVPLTVATTGPSGYYSQSPAYNSQYLLRTAANVTPTKGKNNSESLLELLTSDIPPRTEGLSALNLQKPDHTPSHGGVFTFGRKLNTLSFADLANSSQGDFQFGQSDPSFRGFARAGEQLFTSFQNQKTDTPANQEEEDMYKTEENDDIQFEPVVKMPEKVDLVTGEEDELCLYTHRVKLFRFDGETLQWKERGVGNLKILKNNKNGKLRVLMRREQVLKVCANHLITTTMNLKPLPGSDRAWMWTANDFSDGDAKLEQLAAKFKNPELAEEFKQKFEECQRLLLDIPLQTPHKLTNSDRTAHLIQKAEEMKCGLKDLKSFLTFDGIKGREEESIATAVSDTSELPIRPHREGTGTTLEWDNYDFQEVHDESTNTSIYASPLASSPLQKNLFRFGESSTCFSFNFKPVLSPSKSPAKLSQSRISVGTDDEQETTQEEERDSQFFEPVVPMPDLVKISTGEENEQVVFSHRAKLYRYDKDLSQWKERGIGDLKILQNYDTKRTRLVMRRDQVLKLCANHWITSDMNLEAMKEKAWIWIAFDFAEGEGKVEQLAVRFKLQETANSFKECFDKAKDAQGKRTLLVADPPVSTLTSEKTICGKAAISVLEETTREQTEQPSKSSHTPSGEMIVAHSPESTSKTVVSPPKFVFGTESVQKIFGSPFSSAERTPSTAAGSKDKVSSSSDAKTLGRGSSSTATPFKVPEKEPFVWQVEPTKDDLSQRLSTATRSLEHMNSLLHESEATNAVLMEQISVLKSELRRLERNQEREKSVANLEYLKNVVLRFMLLPAGSEKQALLPVIHTLLQLSPDEKSKLAAIAQGEEEAAHSGRSGWTSYLHSWSGIR